MRRLLLAVALTVTACGGSTAQEAPLDEVLATAGSLFDEMESARFSITVDGVPVSFDDEGTLVATSADGQYDAPESFQALVDVKAFGISAQVGAVSIGLDRWVKVPPGGWTELPADIGFNPLVLFDRGLGVGATVARLDATLIEFDGDYHIQGPVAGPTVEVLTAGLLDGGELDVDLLIAGDSLRIVELAFDTVSDEGVSSWTIEFSEFDEPVTIDSPVE